MANAHETAVRRLAAQGPEKVAFLRSLVDRAEEILLKEGSVPVQPSSRNGDDPFHWETSGSRAGQVNIPFMGSVETSSNGTDLTAYFLATQCRDEDEMRKHIANRMDRYLANAAQIAPFSAPLPSASFFLSPTIASSFGEIGKNDAGVSSFIGEYHLNSG